MESWTKFGSNFGEQALPVHQDTFRTWLHYDYQYNDDDDDDSRSTVNIDAPCPTTLWIALDNVDKEMGPMQVYPGLHNLRLNDISGRVPDEILQKHNVKPVLYLFKQGEGGFHHSLLPHCSLPNSSNRIRRAFIVRFCPMTSHVKEKMEQDSDYHPSIFCGSHNGKHKWMPLRVDYLSGKSTRNTPLMLVTKKLDIQ